MCLAILAGDQRFTDVRPRHPRGGPDGGRDIEALFKGNQKAYGAVGFVNGANDSSEQKRKVRRKFIDDLESAIAAAPRPDAFVFFTNLSLSTGEKEDLIKEASGRKVLHCEIVDRERIRIALDSTDGFAIRFQFLSLPLSEAEQASFFAKWGDDIQAIIATGFQKIERTLQRVLFFHEAEEPLTGFYIGYELDQVYAAEEIGHFRAFCTMHLKGPAQGIFGILFGSSDKSNRMRDPDAGDFTVQQPGIRFGISGGAWEQFVDFEKGEKDDGEIKYTPAGSSSSVGMDSIQYILTSYNHDDHFIRFKPRMRFRDIDQAWYMPMLNLSFAKKVARIHVFAGSYKIQEFQRGEFEIDQEPFEPDIPATFTDVELRDPWVRIGSKRASAFIVNFAEETPVRLYDARDVPNTRPPRPVPLAST